MEKNQNKQTAKRIAEMRKMHAWTQEQLANISGLTIRSIQRYESGGKISFTSLQALSRAFKCGIDEIIDKSNSNSEKSSFEKNDQAAKKNQKETHMTLAMPRMRCGKEVFDISAGAHLFHFDYDELKVPEEVDAVSEFLQNIQDASEIWCEIGIENQVQCAFDCNKWIEKLENFGFSIFGFKRRVVYYNHLSPELRTPMEMAIVIIKRSNDPRIIKSSGAVDTLIAILPVEGPIN